MRLTHETACYNFNYVRTSARQIYRYIDRAAGISVLFCTVLFICCSPREGCKTVCEDDFVEPVTPEEKAAIRTNIAETRSKLYQAPDSAELYRRLAVYYRATGTPEARLRSIEAIDRALKLEPHNPIYHVEKEPVVTGKDVASARVMPKVQGVIEVKLNPEGAKKMEVCPWLMVFPGVTFSLTLLSLNFLGDGLRDALDPQAR